MKNIQITDVGQLKNELRKYKKGAKLDLNQFNQAARLVWLGKAVLQPLDPQDPDCSSYLLYLDYPEAIAERVLDTDQDLIGRMHILDGQQGDALRAIYEEGFQARVAALQSLRQRDFYFDRFYQAEEGEAP